MNGKRWTAAGIATIITAIAGLFSVVSEHYVCIPVKHYGVMDDYPADLGRNP